jgi:predicted RNA-binding protein with PUA-like domain
MAYWLLKSDPDVYSYWDLERDKKTVWDGISNNLALKHLRAMIKGDLAFIYHSGDEKAIVGIAEIISAPYVDPRQKDPKLAVVDIRARRRLARTVLLSEIKARADFKDFGLVRMSRLSVVPVTVDRWEAILEMGAFS